MQMFPMTALLLIKGDQRNLKKVTDTGVGAGDKEGSLVKLSRVEFDQTKCPHEKLLYTLRCGSVGNLLFKFLVSSLVPSSMSSS